MKVLTSARLLILLGLFGCAPAAINAVADSATPANALLADSDLVANEAIANLNTVPPNGLNSLTPEGLSYFQGMGPLEYAARLTGEPDVPIWRIHLQLIPQGTGERDGFSYLVKANHYNLSPAFYNSLVESYGDADPALNDDSPHQRYELTFTPVMSISADWLSDLTQVSQLPASENPSCDTLAQLNMGCAEAYGIQLEANDEDWSASQPVEAAMAPWDSEINPVYAVVRMLAQRSGKLDGETWIDGEIPEGSSAERPWIEIFIDNAAGNGGGYRGVWIERAADDSIRGVVHHVFYGGLDKAGTGIAKQAVVCARGESAGKISAVCP